MRDGKLDVTIGESQAFGGIARGSLGIASADGGVAVTSHVQFVDVDLESCLGQVFGIRKLAGRGNLALNVEGSGSSVLAVTNTLNGTASLTAHDGALAGINVEQLLRRLERRPLSGNGDFRTGRTPFDQFAAQPQDRTGRQSRSTTCTSRGPRCGSPSAARCRCRPAISTSKGVATLVSSATASEFDLPFVVQGQWDDPIMLPGRPEPDPPLRRRRAAA